MASDGCRSGPGREVDRCLAGDTGVGCPVHDLFGLRVDQPLVFVVRLVGQCVANLLQVEVAQVQHQGRLDLFVPSRIGYRQVMPRISAFYGIVIYMYWNEKDHPVAHFHAYHAGRRASVSMDGEVLAGRLEPRALQFVREWAKLRQDEILANWERARRNEPLHGIEPLS